MKKISCIIIICMIVSLTACSSSEEESSSSRRNENTSIIAEKDTEIEQLKSDVKSITLERDNYKSLSESIKTEYDNYKSKMQVYEELELAEAQARKIEADRVIAEETARKQAEEEEKQRQQEEKAKMGYETGITYDQLARDPDDYLYELVKFSGSVLQVLSYDDYTQMRLATKSGYDDIIYCIFPNSIIKSRILEKDNITVYGTSYGLTSYETIMGSTVTLPEVWVDKIEFNDSAVSGTGTYVEKQLPTVEDLEIKHIYKKSYSRTSDYFIITNNSDQAIKISVDAIAKDKEGKMLALGSGSISILGSGETSIGSLSLDTLEYDIIDYDITIDKSKYYRPVVNNLSYETTINQKNIILTVTNNGSYPAEFVEGYIFFFDKKNNLVDTSWGYITDDDSEIKAGATLNKQFSAPKEYDHFEIYFEGRANN